MNHTIVARRYARAIYDLAKEKNEQAVVDEQLRFVSEVLYSDNKIMKVMEHPKVLKEKKKAILSEIVKETPGMVSNLLYLLAEKGRLNIFSDLAKQYAKLKNEEEGIMEATAYTAVPLSEQEIAELNKVFAPQSGKKSLRITSVVDPAILGGVKLQIGNVIYDGTLQSQLQKLERRLIMNRM